MTFPVSRYLTAIAAVAQEELAPAVDDPYLRARADLTTSVLLRLAEDLDGDDATLFAAALASALAGIDTATLPSDVHAQLTALVQGAGQSRSDFDGARHRLSRALGAAFAPDDPGASALMPAVAAVARAEHVVRAHKEAAIAARRAQLLAVRTSSDELMVSAEALSQYLRQRFPGRDVAAVDVRPIPGGRSKATILFTMIDEGTRRDLVMRKDFSRNFMGCSVSDEFPVIQAAYQAGIAAPEPLWLENDPALFNGKFIILARAPGRAAGTMFEMMASSAVVRDYARQLAQVHRIDMAATNLSSRVEFAGAAYPVRQMVRQSFDKHRARTSDDLLLESAHIWMMQNLDCVAPDAVLVHGDAGFHNVLCDDDRMTALLDWELAHAGDPAEDLMKCKVAASQVIPWGEFMDIYVASGGAPVSAARERFFTIWRLVNFSMFAADARAMFESGEDPDLRLAAVGYNTFARLHDALARELSGT